MLRLKMKLLWLHLLACAWTNHCLTLFDRVAFTLPKAPTSELHCCHLHLISLDSRLVNIVHIFVILPSLVAFVQRHP